jgi:hypothetical protein
VTRVGGGRNPSTRAAAFVALFASLLLMTARNAGAADATLSLLGEPQIVFDSVRDGCEAIDVPDINPRAFRDAHGNVVFFGLHLVNRAMRGKDLSHLAIDCHVVLGSGFDPDPAHYNDRNFITATWTADGRDIAALVHHEYHADAHGRCKVQSELGCWYNTILAYRSTNGGDDFVKAAPLVVAAAPFRQEVGQGRHRGFFNPSNIFSDGRYEYFFAATTGWDGQAAGACLFRSADPLSSGAWRAYDGRDFTIRYADPYRGGATAVTPCAPIAPFLFPVGAVVRLRNRSLWIAVFQAARNEGVFPVDGFYYATASDLTHWSAPRLLRAGKTLFSDLCTAGNAVIAYPSLLDEEAQGRNFDNVGDEAYFYYTVIKVADCATGDRLLMRQKISITSSADAANDHGQ